MLTSKSDTKEIDGLLTFQISMLQVLEMRYFDRCYFELRVDPNGPSLRKFLFMRRPKGGLGVRDWSFYSQICQ